MKTVTSPPSFRVTYAWDAVGQRSVMTAPTGGRFSYQYDATGRFSRLINPEGDRTTYAYDVDSRRTVKRLANGTRASFTYDAASNLTTLANMFPDGTYISKYDYKYDPTGNRYAVAEADGSRVTWLYDNLYQLTGENRTGTTPFRNTFTYDPLGNRLTKTESGAQTTYTYDAANQLRYGQDTTGRTTYTFDAAGNQAKEKSPAGAITTTTWNYENQPTLYKLPDATRVTMSYHPDLLRVQKDAPTGTTKFIWDQQNYLVEADGSNVVTTVYTNEPVRYGNLVSSKIGATPYYHSFDAIGSTRDVTSLAGARVGTWIYDAWGTIASTLSSLAVNASWNCETGYVYDVNVGGLYVRARIYRDKSSRWESVDPLLFSNPANGYVYSQNRPMTYSDPSGLEPAKKKIKDVLFKADRIAFARVKHGNKKLKQPFGSNFSAGTMPNLIDNWMKCKGDKGNDGCCCCDEVGWAQVFMVKAEGKEEALKLIGVELDTPYIDRGIPFRLSSSFSPCNQSSIDNMIAQFDSRKPAMYDAPEWQGILSFFEAGGTSYSVVWQACQYCIKGVEGPQSGSMTTYCCVTWGHAAFSNSLVGNRKPTVVRLIGESTAVSGIAEDHTSPPGTFKVTDDFLTCEKPNAEFINAITSGRANTPAAGAISK